MKRCSKCGEEKALEDFNRDKRRHDGRGSHCSSCHNAAARARAGKAEHLPSDIGDRRCSTCGETKPLADFPRRKDAPVGFRSACKLCWREACRLSSQRWTEAHPERALQRARDWRERNAEQERERCARYDEAHREERREAMARSRTENPEHHRELTRKWREANPAKARDAWYRWYEGTRNPSPETVAYIDILLNDPCGYCGGSIEHIDHIEPRALGGTHDWTNLTASCGSCNPSKGKRKLLVWLAGR